MTGDEHDKNAHKGSNDLAEDRTDLAEDRTVLANERTYAGWMRTGLACVGVGLGFRALLRSFEPAWVAKLVATAFILAGAVIIWFAWRHASQVLARLENHSVPAMPMARMGWLSGTMIAAALALAGVLWMF
jgi:putative membrane protein